MKNFLLLLLTCLSVMAAELPPSPSKYFNDYTGTITGLEAEQLDARLSDFDKATSTQVVVVMFNQLDGDYTLEDFCNKAFHAWKVGQAGKNNGVVLFIFKNDHKMRIEVGYGLEGAVPDAIAKRILDQIIKPRFKAEHFYLGIMAGTDAIIAATKGEFQLTPVPTTGWTEHSLGFIVLMVFLAVCFGVFILWADSNESRSSGYSRSRSGSSGYSRSRSGSSGYSRSRSGSSGSGGGFSGGGGDSGGGGASSDW